MFKRPWKNGTWDDSKGGVERGKDYNHSSFCNLIISGLKWFCLGNIHYPNKNSPNIHQEQEGL